MYSILGYDKGPEPLWAWVEAYYVYTGISTGQGPATITGIKRVDSGRGCGPL